MPNVGGYNTAKRWLTQPIEDFAEDLSTQHEANINRMAVVAQLRIIIASENAAKASRSAAIWTKWMAIATGVLAVATVIALAIHG